MATVAKASAKKQGLAVGDWAEFIKGNSWPKKGTLGVIGGKLTTDRYNPKTDSYDDVEALQFLSVDKDGDTDSSTVMPEQVVKIKAPEFIVAWSTEDEDPFTYARTREDADKLAARKRVGGVKVVEARVFKAVK